MKKLCSTLQSSPVSSSFHLHFQRFMHVCLKKKKRAPELAQNKRCPLLPVPQELSDQSGTLGQVKERLRIKAHSFKFIFNFSKLKKNIFI